MVDTHFEVMKRENDARIVRFSAQFQNLDRVREFVGHQAEASGLVGPDVYAVQLSVDEAVSNIIEHAYDGECHEDIECTCQNTEEGLVITLRDCGHPFDPAKVPLPNFGVDLEDRQIGGLGFYFISRLMDEVTFTFVLEGDGKRGCNVLRMLKRKEKAV